MTKQTNKQPKTKIKLNWNYRFAILFFLLSHLISHNFKLYKFRRTSCIALNELLLSFIFVTVKIYHLKFSVVNMLENKFLIYTSSRERSPFIWSHVSSPLLRWTFTHLAKHDFSFSLIVKEKHTEKSKGSSRVMNYKLCMTVHVLVAAAPPSTNKDAPSDHFKHSISILSNWAPSQ